MKRGEIWWADLPPPTGHRPVVLISRDEAYSYRELVTVAPVTRRIRGIPAEVPLGPEDGLPRSCAVNLDSMTTVPKGSLQRPITALRIDKLRAVNRRRRGWSPSSCSQPRARGDLCFGRRRDFLRGPALQSVQGVGTGPAPGVRSADAEGFGVGVRVREDPIRFLLAGVRLGEIKRA